MGTLQQDLEKAIADSLFDAGLRLVFSDWLEEQGKHEEAERERNIAAYINSGDLGSLSGQAMSVLYVLLVEPRSLPEIRAQLERDNGKRREQRLCMYDVMQCVVQAARDDDGWFYCGGGNVGNVYRYPSLSTVCVAAKRTDGKVRVGVAETTGSTGRSPTTPVTG